MPNYVYVCGNSSCEEFSNKKEKFLKIEDCNQTLLCEKCNKVMQKVFSIPINIIKGDNMEKRRIKSSGVQNEIKKLKKDLNEVKSSMTRGEFK